MADDFWTAHGEMVDLDDPETYRSEIWQVHRRVHEIRAYLWGEIGKSIVYMDFMHSDTDWEPQRSRVMEFAVTLASEFHNRGKDDEENRLWWRKLTYRFLDEVENQC